ncbi:neuronal acetylcholine receptor subunit alpha-6-like [Mercenaria mercenaria]|uniref:neuronal acetylcholine receptor subunit alpha-6-like n=1 Tax=Mercenaria mercenaria TaxID=6596 RepID=UPI00234F8BC1|nr:neuronal acetylcholine receptor subunit alpha-6-like [Mercenaria mercenaria]
MDDARKLLSEKMQNYDKNFRPKVNQSAPLILHTSLELVSIQAFDEVQERLTITAAVLMFWADEYMKWDPSKYGGTNQLVVESDKIWTPNIVLLNNINKLEKIGDSWHIVRFLPDGTALYYPGDVLSASCPVDVTYYPWDRHKCSFIFTVWAHSPYEIRFKSTNDKVQTSYFSENGAWTFLDSDVKEDLYGTALTFVLYLERKPLFVLINVIIPIIFMAYLNAVTFLIPSENGERISCSITVLLALAVFLTLVGDNLPKTSSPLSFFSYYLLVVLGISICMTLATVFNVRLYYKHESDPVPSCLSRLANCSPWKRKTKKKKMYLKNIVERTGHLKGNYAQGQLSLDACLENPGYQALLNSKRNIIVHRKDHFDKHRGTLSSGRDEANTKQNQNHETFVNVSWKEISVLCDKMFFVLSVIALTITTVIFFVKISTGSQD